MTPIYTPIELAWYQDYQEFCGFSRPTNDRPIHISPIGHPDAPEAYAISMEGSPAYALMIVALHTPDTQKMIVVDVCKVKRVIPPSRLVNNSTSSSIPLWITTLALLAERGIKQID